MSLGSVRKCIRERSRINISAYLLSSPVMTRKGELMSGQGQSDAGPI